jgi:hypothetical protein
MKGNARKHEGKQHRNKTQMENMQCDHVKKAANKKQRSRLLKYMKTLTHLKMAM